MESEIRDEILRIEDLRMHFPIRTGVLSQISGYVYAVDGVSFAVRKGQTLGLVGESGCGKTTVGRCITRLYRPTGGKILFEGEDFSRAPRRALKTYRRHVQMVFQDPYSSLNPRMRVQEIIGEAVRIFNLAPKNDWRGKVRELMVQVGLQPELANRYPHEFSGGQRQRIGIARALALGPKLIVADEPVSALDASIQAQVINLLSSLKKKFELSYLFISHDLSVVEHVSNNIAVMYLGHLVEIGTDRDITTNPHHPYTKALLSAIPVAGSGGKERLRTRERLSGDVPSPISPPKGCRFHTRCGHVMDECRQNDPPPVKVGSNHFVNCFLYE
jgi:oligopeptide/dipeptide ABC transporter ATP-binding protein